MFTEILKSAGRCALDTKACRKDWLRKAASFGTDLLTTNYHPKGLQGLFIIGHSDRYRYGRFIDVEPLRGRNDSGGVCCGVVPVSENAAI